MFGAVKVAADILMFGKKNESPAPNLLPVRMARLDLLR